MNAVLVFGCLILPCSLKVFADEYVTTSSPANSTEQRVEVAADALFDEYWQTTLMDDPELATTLGDHRYDDRLTEYNLKSYEKRKVILTEFLERATQLLPLAAEKSDTHNNIQMFTAILQYKIDQLESRSYLFPRSVIQTPQISLQSLLKYTKMKESKNYWDLIARYRAFPQQIDEQIELMREGIRTNFTLNELSLWIRDDRDHDVTKSPFYRPFLNVSSSVTPEEADRIQNNASDAVMNDIYPALEKIDDFMENEYRPNTRPEIGVSSLPNGLEYYRQQLVFHLTDQEVTAEEIHAAGVEEVLRIAEEMDKVIESLGLNMTRKEFSNKLRSDESNFFSSPEELLQTFRNVITNQITPKLQLVFKSIPEKVLTIESVPSDMPGSFQYYYLGASPDNSTPATVFLDTSSFKNLPRYEVITIAMHEGVPGHHIQVSYAMEQNGIPDFRKYGLNSNAFIEGWALYAEYLGYELGLYEDPYMRYGHLSKEIFRASRMVVDTGIHVFGWSRQDAIDYLTSYSASPLRHIEREVDRYITWPGQACAYKYGEIKIEQLRKRSESALGAEFDIKEFHDVILRNGGPLKFVERQVDRYIETVLEQ